MIVDATLTPPRIIGRFCSGSADRVTEARDAIRMRLRLISDQKPQACVIDIGVPYIETGNELAREATRNSRTLRFSVDACYRFMEQGPINTSLKEACFDYFLPPSLPMSQGAYTGLSRIASFAVSPAPRSGRL